MNFSKSLCLFTLFFISVSNCYSGGGTCDVFDFGAKGDGKSLDTQPIQSAIDECSKNGGGKVYLHNGTFLSGTIYLKDNITLYFESGTVLLGSPNLNDYPSIKSNYLSYTGEFVTNKMLIYAEDVRNISIEGRGTIDGRGDDWVKGPYGFPSFSVRPRIIHFRNCQNIRVTGITLFNSASWVQSYQSCENVVIDGITVDSRENKDVENPNRFYAARGRNCDGIDIIDSKLVRISNSYINSGDDAIVLKSLSPDDACRNITITNCIVSSHASGIKIGTETSGGFEDITVNNCVVFDTKGDAINVSTVDGAKVERINISNISIRNVKGTAIFIRLGARGKSYQKTSEREFGMLSEVTIKNITGTDITSGCSISGIGRAKLKNILIKDIDLEFDGGGAVEDLDNIIPENDKAYPSSKAIQGSENLPSYGFFIRHANKIILDNIKLRFKVKDHRPAIFAEDVEDLRLNAVDASYTALTSSLLYLKNARDVTVSNFNILDTLQVLTKLDGEDFSNIVIRDNQLRKVRDIVEYRHSQVAEKVFEIGNIR